MQFKDAAYEILKQAGEPLHYNEITDRALSAGTLKLIGFVIVYAARSIDGGELYLPFSQATGGPSIMMFGPPEAKSQHSSNQFVFWSIT